MKIRTERAVDVGAVRVLHLAAFGEHGAAVSRLVDLLRPVVDRGQGVSLVAEERTRIVGHVMCSESHLDTLSQLVPVQVLSPLAVLPGFQGRGNGALLVRAAIAAVAALDAPVLFLEGNPAYYSRFGFTRALDQGFRKPSLRIPEAAFQAVRLPSYESWMTGTLVYAPEFWIGDAVGLREPALSRALEELNG